MKDFFQKKLTKKFHPFCPPFLTLGSFLFALYNFFEGGDYPLYCIDDERGHTSVRQSMLERKWVLEKWKEYGEPTSFISQATNGRAIRIGKYTPDYVYFENDMSQIKEVRKLPVTQNYRLL